MFMKPPAILDPMRDTTHKRIEVITCRAEKDTIASFNHFSGNATYQALREFSLSFASAYFRVARDSGSIP
jgi:hypothetical protein